MTINTSMRSAGAAFLLSASVGVLSACSGPPGANATGEVSGVIAGRVAEAFPNTNFDRVYPHSATGLVAAETGNKIIFLTADAKHVLAGEVFDLVSKTNITELRERELASSNALEAAVTGASKAVGVAARPSDKVPTARAQAGAMMTVDLPGENMVVHNPGGSEVVYVVADYNCGYCKRLFAEMEGIDVEVREIPVSYLSPDSGIKGASVLCADDKAAAARDFLMGTADMRVTTCMEGTQQVEQNTLWAQSMGIGGTPFLIRPSGQTNSGYLPADRLKAFLEIS